jgi:hypothetical protein
MGQIDWGSIIVGSIINQSISVMMMFVHPGSLWKRNGEPSYKTQVFVLASVQGDAAGAGNTTGGYAPDVEVYDMYGYKPAEGQKGKMIKDGEFYEYNLPNWSGDEEHGPSTRPPEYISLFACTPPLTVAVMYYA